MKYPRHTILDLRSSHETNFHKCKESSFVRPVRPLARTNYASQGSFHVRGRYGPLKGGVTPFLATFLADPFFMWANQNLNYTFVRAERSRPKPSVKNFTARSTPLRLLHPALYNYAKRFSSESTQVQQLPLPLFTVHFLRKERIYTKLKYSRCPQYDIVSGGFAAIFAGFIGFLISEKFGIELVDSGDFYIALMYGVFATFAIYPLVRIYSKYSTPYNPFSLKYLLSFTTTIIKLLISFVLKVCRW